MAATLTRKLAYAPLASQSRYHRSRARFKLFTGPVGSGKTIALVQEAIRLSVVNHGRLGLIGAPTYRILHDTTERTFFETLDTNKIPYRYKKSDREVYLTDLRTKIIFRTLDDPKKLVGTNLAFFGIDELSYSQEASFQRLQARLRDPKARELCGFAATTPNGLNWVYNRWLGDQKNQDFEIIQAQPKENSHLPSDFYDTLARSYDPRFYEQEVLGKFLALQSGTAYNAFDRGRNLDETIEFRPGATLCWCLDFNNDPMCSTIAQIVDYAPNPYSSNRYTKRVEVIDEICVRDGTVNMACAEFVDRCKRLARMTYGHSLVVNIYGDSSGHNSNHAGTSDWAMVKDYFKRENDYRLTWHVPAGNPPVKDRVNSVNAMLYGADKQVKLTIHPRCKSLINDLERVTWARDTAGNYLGDLSKKDKMLSHVSDSLGYLMSEEFSAARLTTAAFRKERPF